MVSKKIGIGNIVAIGFRRRIKHVLKDIYYLLWDSNDRIKMDNGDVIIAKF